MCVQIAKETKSLKSLLQKFNACDCVEGVLSTNTISITEVLEPSNIEERLRAFGCCYNHVATGRKRQIMDAYLGLCRSREELSMLRKESENMVSYYQEREKSILLAMADSEISRGARAMLHHLLDDNKRKLQHAGEAKKYLHEENSIESIDVYTDSSDEDNYSDASDDS